MTVMEISILAIATINVVLMIAMVVLLSRVMKVLKTTEEVVREQAVPLIEKVQKVADDVKKISNSVRQVEERLTGVATRVIDQVEPPVRAFSALIAGVRAGVGKMMEGNHRGDGNGIALANHGSRERSR